MTNYIQLDFMQWQLSITSTILGFFVTTGYKLCTVPTKWTKKLLGIIQLEPGMISSLKTILHVCLVNLVINTTYTATSPACASTHLQSD